MQPNELPHPRFERSEDGKAWTEIDLPTVRRRLSGYYRNVEQVIQAMTENGQPVRTPFARYRFVR